MSDIILSRAELVEDLTAERQRAARLEAALIQARQRAELAEASARTGVAIGSVGLRAEHRATERVEAQAHMNPDPIRETRSERVLASRCGNCGETFEPTRPHQRYCRPSCRRAAFTGRRAQPRLPVRGLEDLFLVPFE